MAIGILAYGSLIKEPGEEIERVIAARKPCVTPFLVEFSRLSRTRGGAPTLVRVNADGSSVSAEIFVLKNEVRLQQAKTLLWKRETRHKGDRQYRESPDPESNPDKVLVRVLEDFEGVETVLYTDFPESGKLQILDAVTLAKAAVASAKDPNVAAGRDGISYLINAKADGIETRLRASYEREILAITKTTSLKEALEKSRPGST